jgi:NAD(P)-dependent dehydrogenase (short-subunit alcohol dehydrogenase family)
MPAFVESVRHALATQWSRDSFDFLVNNAGLSALTPIGETTMDTVDVLVDVHFKGVVFLTQVLLPVIADGGRIINFSSSLTRTVLEGHSVYAAVKGAVETYSSYLAKELGKRRISVNAVAPGPIATDLGGGQLKSNPQLRAAVVEQTALGRFGEPGDIGGVVAGLLAPGTAWITGQRVEVSGGMLL